MSREKKQKNRRAKTRSEEKRREERKERKEKRREEKRREEKRKEEKRRERNRGKVVDSTVIYYYRFKEMKNIQKAACARTASIFRAYRELVAALSISAIYLRALKFDFLSLRT